MKNSFLAVRLLVLSLTFSHFAVATAWAVELYSPPNKGEWEKADLKALGWNEEKAKEFSAFVCSVDSTGALVLHKGKIAIEVHCPLPDKNAVPENYWRIYRGEAENNQPIEDVASIQKSIVSFLIGVAAGKKLVDPDVAVSSYLGAGWSQASAEQEAAITLRHLLSMASGLDEKLRYEAPAGTLWRYNTTAYRQLISVLEKVTGKTIQAISEEWLLKPTGMLATSWQDRGQMARQVAPWGSPYGFTTTPRDLARFGLLMLAGGVWNGKDLLKNPGWLEKSFSASQNDNPAYGYLWWLNGTDRHKQGRGRPEEEKGPLIENAPADLKAAFGGGDRRLYVVPSKALVVTRLGAPAGGGVFEYKFWSKLNLVIPKVTK
jgi:CubicO group peptidase (beta-lactamase class C family)